MPIDHKVFIIVLMLRFATFFAIIAGAVFIALVTVKIECVRFKNVSDVSKLTENKNKFLIKELLVAMFVIVVNTLYMFLPTNTIGNQFIAIMMFVVLPVVLTLLVMSKASKKLISEFRTNMSKHK